MKTLILTAVLFASHLCFAAPTAKTYHFKFKAPLIKSFEIAQKAHTQEEAYKLAAQECFKKLTQGKYPGEEKGLQIIDICANPKI